MTLNSSNKIKGLMLDMDGTLIHFQIDYNSARQKTIEILENHGFPKGKLTLDNFVLRMVAIACEFFENEMEYSSERISLIRKECDLAVEKVERKASYKALPIDGIETMLQFATKNQLKLGIITLNTTANALISLKTAGLAKYFSDSSLIIGRDRSPGRTKPDIHHGQVLLSKMGLNPEEVCLIGDHPSDIETAVKLGARSIAVVTEKHPSHEFNTSFFVHQSKIFPKIVDILRSL
jgi:phosphoglycolate phosphatase